MNVELLDRAIDIIAGLAEEQVDLSAWRSGCFESAQEVTCGTICCAGGWLALNPEMQALGLTHDDNGSPMLDGCSGYSALAQLFDLSYGEGFKLFKYVSHYDAQWMATDALSDKEIWLNRARLLRDDRARFQAVYDCLPLPGSSE
jgi:hypothetical protein